jgi:Fe-S cluster assembly ATP-binding protein
MLQINNLSVCIGENRVLDELCININPGEVHAIMGPNGAGKSTLAKTIAGHDSCLITGGSMSLDGDDLVSMSPEERAIAGVFLAFQYPVEIPGVANLYFIRTALNSIRKAKGLKEFDAMDFLKIAKEKMQLVEMDKSFMNRAVNEGFSGGEKKRNEILQMAILEPKLAILDEIDSGLDIDSLRIIGKAATALKSKERSMLLITHYQRLLDYIVPDYVHVMVGGKIVESGGKDLALHLEQKGYTGFIHE